MTRRRNVTGACKLKTLNTPETLQALADRLQSRSDFYKESEYSFAQDLAEAAVQVRIAVKLCKYSKGKNV